MRRHLLRCFLGVVAAGFLSVAAAAVTSPVAARSARPPAAVCRVIAFPRNLLATTLADADLSKTGTKIESPPFEAGGLQWKLALYPFGGNADPELSGRVGIYLSLQGGDDASRNNEVDATFQLSLKVCTASEAEQREAAQGGGGDVPSSSSSTLGARGLTFRCGMTFCAAAEAGLSIGRCEDWGAHVYPTDLLLKELEVMPEGYEAAVEVDVAVWSTRRCERGAGLTALAEQVRRLPGGHMRVGEVIVALGGDDDKAADDGGGDASSPRLSPGVEYRVMRLTTSEGEARFDTQGGDVTTVHLVPVLKVSREGCTFVSNEERVRARLAEDGSGAFFLRERDDGAWAQLPSSSSSSAGGGGVSLPMAVPLSALPPLASRLGFRALPARLGYAARTNLVRVALFLLIGASPLWGGFLVSQLGSAYVIPSRSMEATLRVGDVVLAEKASSRLLSLPYDRGDLVLFSPPESLLQLVAEGGGKLDSRDLFVKRVAAVGGDTVELLPSGGVAVNGVPRKPAPLACGDSAAPAPAPASAAGDDAAADAASASRSSSTSVRRTVPEGNLFVLGDCPARSTDSRTWGVLPTRNVVARPVVRVWPPERTGAIDDTADLNPFRRALERR